jgi:hypothetical protein
MAMTWLQPASWLWMLSSADEALAEQRRSSLRTGPTALAAFSALFSAALAESVMVPGTLRDLALAVVLYTLAYGLLVALLRQFSRLVGATPPAAAWFQAAAIAILPGHLLLPAALIARPLGSAGIVLYEGAKIMIGFVLARRGVAVLIHLLGWPAWAALLLLVSPFLIGLAGLLLFATLLFFAAGAAMLAALS